MHVWIWNRQHDLDRLLVNVADKKSWKSSRYSSQVAMGSYGPTTITSVEPVEGDSPLA